MSERVRIKVCGLTRPEDALAAVRLGVDFLGFVFVREWERALDVHAVEWLPALDTGQAKRVGVFRDEPATWVNDVVRRLRLDLVQLEGHEPRDYPRALDVPAIVRRGASDHDGLLPLAPNVFAALLGRDGRNAGRHSDPPAAPERCRAGLPEAARVFLSGGLTAANVAGLAATCHAFAVDVATSVECAPGIKDAEKVRAFCTALGRHA